MIKDIRQADPFSVSIVEFERMQTLVDLEKEFVINQSWKGNINNSVGKDYSIFDTIELNSIGEFCLSCVNAYNKKIFGSNTKLRIVSSWANCTAPGESHHMHKHPNSIISGVFYINSTMDVPIIFQNPLKNLYNTVDYYDEETNYNRFEALFGCGENCCIIFPSYLNHMVAKNNTKENRYSIAFNAFYEKDQHLGAESTFLDL